MIDPIKFTFDFDDCYKQLLDELLKKSGCCCDSKDPIDFSDVPMGQYSTKRNNLFAQWQVIFDTNAGEIEVHIPGNDAKDAIITATMDIRRRDNIDWWKVKSAKIFKTGGD